MALKLPALWPDNPRKRFLYCEGKFRIHKITAQQTMFDHCIHAMTADQSDDYGLVVNPKKCVLGKSSLEFIGHCVTSSGVRPLQERVQHITDFPRPQSTKSLKEFLGMLNFYRRFVPQAAAILNPLYDLVNVKYDEF